MDRTVSGSRYCCAEEPGIRPPVSFGCPFGRSLSFPFLHAKAQIRLRLLWRSFFSALVATAAAGCLGAVRVCDHGHILAQSTVSRFDMTSDRLS